MRIETLLNLSPLPRQHTSAYVSIRPHTAAYGSIRQHMSACVRMRIETLLNLRHSCASFCVSIRPHTSAYGSIRPHTAAYVRIRQHASAYGSIREHTAAYVRIHIETLSHSCASFCVSIGSVVLVTQVNCICEHLRKRHLFRYTSKASKLYL